MDTEIVYRNVDGQAVTSSLLVADTFEKNHKEVLRDIEQLFVKAQNCALTENQQLSKMFFKTIYESALNNGTGALKRNPMYLMNRDGFTLLVMGYTGEKALSFKLKFIEAFNLMEQQLQKLPQANNLIMESQMQFMQQMVNICTTMMSRLERIEQQMGFQSKDIVQPAHPAIIVKKPKIVHKHPEAETEIVAEGSNQHGFCRPGKYSKHVFYTNEIHALYPQFKKVRDVAKAFRAKGIPVHQKSFFRYLRAKGYLCSDYTLYNRPSLECEESGWMVSVWSGPNKQRKPKTCSYVPYLSPEFVNMLEMELRKELSRESRQLTLPLDKKQ